MICDAKSTSGLLQAREDQIDPVALARTLARKKPTPNPGRSGANRCLAFPLLGLAACGGGGTIATPPPPPPPPPPAVGPTAVADGPAGITAGAAAISGNVLTNDAVGTGAVPTVTAFSLSGGAAGTVGQMLTTSLGDLTLGSNGAYTFSVASNAAVRALRPGEIQDILINYTADNSIGTSSSTLTIRVTGINDAPSATALILNITEDSPISFINNPITLTDPDPNQTVQITGVAAGTTAAAGNVGAPVTGTYGRLIVGNIGSVNYELNNASPVVQGIRAGETVNDVFTLQISDGAGGTSTTTITIAVLGANDAPIAVADSFTLASSSTSITGNLLANDRDPDGQTLILPTINGISIAASGSTGIPNQFASGLPLSLQAQQNGAFTYTVSQSIIDGLGAGQSFYDYYSYAVRDTFGLTANSFVRFTYTKPGGTQITGTAGADTLLGTNGDDVINGGAGNDIIRGGLGRNTLIGGDGNDELIVDLIPSNGNTILNFYELARTEFFGGGGNDRLVGGGVSTQNIAIYTGKFGDYIYNGTLGTVTDTNLTDGDEGTDILVNINQLVFSDIVVSIGINPNNRPFPGTPDHVEGVVASGSSTSFDILGTALIDLDGQPLTYSLVNSDGSAAPSWLTVDQNTKKIIATPPAGTSGVFELILVGSDGVLPGFDRFRLYVWDSATATVSASNTISGTAGSDTIVATSAAATILGSPGADIYIGAASTNLASTVNYVSYANSGSAITVNGATNTLIGGDADGDRLYGISRVTGTNFADSFTAGPGLREFYGGNGDDIFVSTNLTQQSSVFYGEAGDDRFLVNTGRAVVEGGSGADYIDATGAEQVTLQYTSSDAAVTLAPEFNIFRGGHATGDQIVGSITSFIGSTFSDILVSNRSGRTDLNGGDGNDLLIARSTSTSGDFTTGGFGADTLVTLAGKHVVFGDSGVDTIIVAATANTPANPSYDINIQGFAQPERDKLDLSDLRDAQGNVLDFQDILSNTTDIGASLRINLGNFRLDNGSAISGSITLGLVADIADITAADFIFQNGADWQALLPADIIV
jgi:VCBS repeat-containing protein